MQEYELELGSKRIYSLVALTALYAGHYKEFSRAIMKLEGKNKY